MKNRNNYTSEETREKMRLAQRKRYEKPEEHLKLRGPRPNAHFAFLGRRLSEETKQKIRIGNTGKQIPQTTRMKMSLKMLSNHNGFGYNTILTPEMIAKRAETLRQRWQDKQYANRRTRAMMLGQHRKPNRIEAILLSLLETHFPNCWKYVGDGSFVIDGLNPDFINTNGKKQIIEVFGNYWHKTRVRNYRDTEQGRISAFAQYGYATLVIWESEFVDRGKLLQKLIKFEGGNNESTNPNVLC